MHLLPKRGHTPFTLWLSPDQALEGPLTTQSYLSDLDTIRRISSTRQVSNIFVKSDAYQVSHRNGKMPLLFNKGAIAFLLSAFAMNVFDFIMRPFSGNTEIISSSDFRSLDELAHLGSQPMWYRYGLWVPPIFLLLYYFIKFLKCELKNPTGYDHN